MSRILLAPSGRRARLAAACACTAAALFAAAPAGASRTGVPLAPNGKPIASASTEACVTSVNQIERSATFVGEMLAVPGTVRMKMRIDVLERGPADARFRTISYPGLGQWVRSSAGVKAYR